MAGSILFDKGVTRVVYICFCAMLTIMNPTYEVLDGIGTVFGFTINAKEHVSVVIKDGRELLKSI